MPMNNMMQSGITGLDSPAPGLPAMPLPAVSLPAVSPSNRSGTRRAAALKAAAWSSAAVFAGLLAAGCATNSESALPLTPGRFLTHSVDNSSINNPVDKPGAIQYDAYRVQTEQGSPPPVEVGQTVRESVKSPDAEARQEAANLAGQPAQPGEHGPATAPTTRDAQAYGWLLNGCVLEEINGTAIFSDKVISAIQKPLVAEAKKGDEYRFRSIASNLYENQIHVYERDELEYASAQKALEAEDEQTARGMTMQWRQKKVTEAGGSLELARRRAAADGWDFDKQVEQQYRLHLVQIYYQKRIIPLIQVTAADLRTYYDLHKDTEFTTHGQARFRVIKIDPKDHLGREDALNIAQEVRKEAATEDFAALAKKMNDDPAWQATGGVVGDRDGYVQKGAFRVQEVEEAVWKLRPGEVSDIISANKCFYIAKLEQLTEDKVEDFDSEQVQDKIRDQLRSQQFTALREKHVGELMKDAITRRNDDAIRETLASIIEQYPMWKEAR
jgi:hypothetical protein